MFSKYEGKADIILLSRNMLGTSMNSISLLMNGILMKTWRTHYVYLVEINKAISCNV